MDRSKYEQEYVKPRKTTRSYLTKLVFIFFGAVVIAGIYVLMAPKQGWPTPEKIQQVLLEIKDKQDFSAVTSLLPGAAQEVKQEPLETPKSASPPQVETNLAPSGIPFVNRVSSSSCADSIQSRILWRDTSIAFLTRDACAEIRPKALAPEEFATIAADHSLMIVQNKIFDSEGVTTESTIAYCRGVDERDRKIELAIKRRTSDRALFARLIMTTGRVVETVAAFVTQTDKSTKQYLFTTKAGKDASPPEPYLNLSIAKANGWTGFVDYSLEFVPKTPGPNAWRNDRTNLTHCYWP